MTGFIDPRSGNDEPKTATIVTGLKVRANRPHEHNGTLYLAGQTFAIPCELGSRLMQQGHVELIEKLTEEIEL